MDLALSKQELLTISGDLHRIRHRPFRIMYPAFLIELQYVDYFSFLVQGLSIGKETNVIPILNTLFERTIELAIKQVCRMLDQYNADGSTIFSLLNEGMPVLRQDWRRYNRQAPIPGKKIKAFPKPLWEDYNHWLIAGTLWKGFLHSFEPRFTINLPEDALGPLEMLLDAYIKPLWGMYYSFNELGRPFITNYNDNDSVSLSPFESWYRYKAQMEEVNKLIG